MDRGVKTYCPKSYFTRHVSFVMYINMHVNTRNTLLNETLSIANISVLKILHGDERLCMSDNMKLHQAVSRFIISTKRFNIY